MSRKKLPLLRILAQFLRPHISLEYDGDSSLYLPDKRLILTCPDSVVVATYATPRKNNSNELSPTCYFKIDLADPNSFDMIKQMVIKFKHPYFRTS